MKVGIAQCLLDRKARKSQGHALPTFLHLFIFQKIYKYFVLFSITYVIFFNEEKHGKEISQAPHKS